MTPVGPPDCPTTAFAFGAPAILYILHKISAVRHAVHYVTIAENEIIHSQFKNTRIIGNWLCLGLNWVCFGFVFYPPEGGFIVIIFCIIDIYVHFGSFGSWV